MKMRMITILWSLTLVMILAASAYWLWYAAPFKVKDPSDPKFNPDKFAFRDYYDEGEISIREAYRRLFPIGVSKEFVSRVLVNAGGTKINCTADSAICFYTRPQRLVDYKGGIQDKFLFDSDMKLIRGNFHGDYPEYRKTVDFKTK